MKFATRLDIPPSTTVKIHDLANQKKKEGIHIFNFAAGEPVIPVHPFILEAAEKEMNKGYIPYPPVLGIPELRKAAAKWMDERYGCPYLLENTIVTPSGKFALFLLLQALIEKDDEVMLFSPYWVSYPPMVQLCGGKAIAIPSLKKNNWRLPVHELDKHLTSKTKVIILNNACNPTGALYSREEIADLLKFAKQHDLFVISDEVYSEINYTHHPFISCGFFPEYKERIAVVQSCSKNFGMTGWRIGFIFTQPTLLQKLAILQSQSLTTTSIVSQWGALGAVEHAREVSLYVKKAMQKRRDLFLDSFKQRFGISLTPPTSAIYQFISLEELNVIQHDSVLFCEKLLQEANVALTPGLAFGQEGYVRFAFSEKEEEIVKGVNALKTFCEKYLK